MAPKLKLAPSQPYPGNADLCFSCIYLNREKRDAGGNPCDVYWGINGVLTYSFGGKEVMQHHKLNKDFVEICESYEKDI